MKSKPRWQGQPAWWRGGASLILLVSALTGCIPSSDAPPGPNRAADLSSLELSEGALSPAFGPDELNYTVSVGSNVSAITVTVTVADARATVRINNNPAQSGQPFGPINLELGTNPPITILVSGPGISKSYTIVVTRAPNADLQALELSAGALAPAFSPNETNYMVETGFNTPSTTVTAKVADDTSTLAINGNAANSGQPFGPVTLAVGSSNVIVIRVTAANGVTKDYQITVLRTGTTNLATLSVSAGPIAPAFNPNTLAYSVSTGFTTDQTTISVGTADSSASVTVKGQGPVQGGGSFGPFPLAVGQNNFTIVVTSPTVASKTYTVTITRQPPSTNALLSGLSVNPGALEPDFSSNIFNYTVDVASTVSTISVTATRADTNASVTINGVGGSSQNISLNAAGTPTVISIVVLAQDGVTARNYLITVNRTLSGNANLSTLSVSQGSLSPAFNANTQNYTVNVGSSVTSVNVSATKADENATMSGSVTAPPGQSSGQATIQLGGPGTSTPVSITVTAPNGSQKVYSIIVNRAMLGGNNNLQSLSVSPGTLSPSFNANTLNYTVDVGSSVGSVTVTATPQDGGATVSINGQTTTSRSVTLGAAGSSTSISIVVTAPNGSQKTYSVVVNRAALGGNNNLQSLSVSPGSLSPAFNANTQNYTVDVGSNVGSVTVTAMPQDSSATVSINGQTTTSRSVTLGAAGSSTPISIIVTAPNGSQKPYSVVVNRAALGGNNNLQSLSVSPGQLSPTFNANTQDYTVNVTSDVGSVTVTAIPQDGSATVSINGQTTTSRSVTLGGGGSSTLVSIIVTAPNGSQKPYSIIVNREAASGNAGLSSLTVSAGTLTPTFMAPGTAGSPGYTVSVPNTVTSFTVTAAKADPNATMTINGVVQSSATVNPLPAGNTVFTIVVTAQAGNSLTYFVTVSRAP